MRSQDVPRDFGGVPILMYHEVIDRERIDSLGGKTQRGYIVARDEFDRQMRLLSESGFHPITLDELYLWRCGEGELPSNPIVISFDDGYAGNQTDALPVLRQYGFRAVFFVVTNKIGDPQMLSWGQLEDLVRNGMSIQSHTANHPLLSTIDEDRTREELVQSRQCLEEYLGIEVRFVSLPNGDSNRHYVRIAREGGYRGGCCSRFGFNWRDTDPYYWRRIAIKNGTSLKQFRCIVERDPRTLRKMSAVAAAKYTVARLLGKAAYNRLYTLVYGLEEQEKLRQP